MVEPRDVEFEVEGGDRLRGWLFAPATGPKRYPAISMAHGYAGVKEHGLRRFAQAFAEAGFVVLVRPGSITPWEGVYGWRSASV